MNEERRTKNEELRKKRGASSKKRSGSVDARTAELSGHGDVPKRSLGTRTEEATGDARALSGLGTRERTGGAPTGLTMRTSPMDPVLTDADYDLEIPGESSRDRGNRLAKLATARRRELLEQAAAEVPPERPNPLFRLSEESTQKLFTWLRECPYHDAVKAMLAEQGIAGVTDAELDDFFQSEANAHWQRRLSRAATEANALVTYIESHPVKFSAGILAALGQEAFRQIASGQVAPEAMTRLTNLFLKARADERSDQLLELRREKLNLERRTLSEAALEEFAAEIAKHPEAREAFEALRAELARVQEVTE